MRQRMVVGILMVLAAATLGGRATAAAKPAKAAGGATETYVATMAAANGSGVSGTAHLTLEGSSLHVVLDASGLTPGKTHMAHLHGKTGENVDCAMKDTDGDGLVDEKEAEAHAGKEVLFLEPYLHADKAGKAHLDHTYRIDAKKVGPIGDRVLEIHGLTHGGKWLEKLPVACGKPAKP